MWLPSGPSSGRARTDGGDPHIWLSPSVVASAATSIALSLESLDPAGASTYRRNLENLLREIEVLDREIAAGFAGIENGTILVFHPAWGHFADRYGLEQVAIEDDGKEPSPTHLVELIEEARRRGWSTVFVQRGFFDRSAEVVAQEIGAEVVVIDPMAYEWLENLRSVAGTIQRTLSSDAGGSDG